MQSFLWQNLLFTFSILTCVFMQDLQFITSLKASFSLKHGALVFFVVLSSYDRHRLRLPSGFFVPAFPGH